MAEIVLGAMLFGTRMGEAASFALLDRFVDRGGRWIDTSDNYAFWEDPSGLGGQSERVIGRWPAATDLKLDPELRARLDAAS